MHLLVNFEEVADSCAQHYAVVETIKSFNALGHEFLHEMHMCNDLRVVQTTHNVDKDSLQVIWVHEKLLRWDIVPAPEQIDLLTDLLGAAIVYPLEFTHRALYTRQFLQVTDRQAVRLACVYVSGVTGAAPFAAHVR